LKEPDTAAYPDLWKAETIRDFSLQMVGKWGERNALTNHLMASFKLELSELCALLSVSYSVSPTD
jgi:hypothetical protein